MLKSKQRHRLEIEYNKNLDKDSIKTFFPFSLPLSQTLSHARAVSPLHACTKLYTHTLTLPRAHSHTNTHSNASTNTHSNAHSHTHTYAASTHVNSHAHRHPHSLSREKLTFFLFYFVQMKVSEPKKRNFGPDWLRKS